MEKMKYDTIGVDVSKGHLDTHRLADGAARRFANDKCGHKARWPLWPIASATALSGPCPRP
jgi:hypothetical protein